MSSKLITTCAECTTKCISEHSTRSRHSYRTYELTKFRDRVNKFYESDEELWHEEINPFSQKLKELISELLSIAEDFDRDCLNRKVENAFQSQKGKDKELIDAARAAVQGEYAALTCRDVAKIEQRIELQRKISYKEISKISSQLKENAEERLTAAFNKLFQLDKRPSKYKSAEETPRNEKEREKSYTARESQKTPTQKQKQSDQQKAEIDSEFPTVKIRQIPHISTHFNILLKVISVDKEFYLDKQRKVQFQAGDETGKATVVSKALKFIKQGTVITIFNARIYNFHGSKQIQMAFENSYIVEENSKNVIVNNDFNLSGQPRKDNRQNRDRRRQSGDINDRNRQDRPRREGRQREDRPKREESSKGEQRQYRKDFKREEKPYIRQRDQQMYRQRERERKERAQRDRKKRQQEEQEEKKYEQTRLKGKDRESFDASRSNRKTQEQLAPQRDRAKYQQDQAKKNPILPNLIKIKDITPGQQNLSFIAEIFEFRPKQKPVDSKKIVCILGDETAIVEAQLPRLSGVVKLNTIVYLCKVESRVINSHIRLCLADDNNIKGTTMKIPRIKTDINISADEYEEQEEDSDDQQVPESEDEEETPMAEVEDF